LVDTLPWEVLPDSPIHRPPSVMSNLLPAASQQIPFQTFIDMLNGEPAHSAPTTERGVKTLHAKLYF